MAGTTNYNFTVQADSDNYNIAVYNAIFEAIDTALKTISDNATPDSALSGTSEKAVQNKIVKAALDGKLGTAGGTMTGAVTLVNPALNVEGGRNIKISTVDLTAGTSALASGSGYWVYE